MFITFEYSGCLNESEELALRKSSLVRLSPKLKRRKKIPFLCKEFGELSVWHRCPLVKLIKEDPKEECIVRPQNWASLKTPGVFCSLKQLLLWSLTR